MEKTNYESARKHLIIKALNVMYNKRELENAVYKTIGDIALVLYAKIAEEDDILISKIAKDIFAEWKVDIEKVFKEAMKNTCESEKPRIYKNLLRYKDGGSDFMAKNYDEKLKTEIIPLITTESHKNGAISLFYDGTKEKLAEMYGDSFYVAFTSVHEAMLHKRGTIEPSSIKEHLRATNRAFGSEETLSNEVFYYDMETGSFDVVA